MRIVWLETSALIGLVFCGQGQTTVQAVAPQGTEWTVSRYVLFELGRGYVSYLIRMHNESLNCRGLGELLGRTNCGQLRHRSYERSAWVEDISNYLVSMEEHRDAPWGLEDLREKLWTRIRRGWRKSRQYLQPEGCCPCRADLPSPTRGELNQPIEHPLPVKKCGQASACGLLGYLRIHALDFTAMASAEEALPSRDVKAKERMRRGKALRALLDQTKNTFKKGQCYSSADAIIAHEARRDFLMTRDRDYEALCVSLKSAREPFPT